MHHDLHRLGMSSFAFWCALIHGVCQLEHHWIERAEETLLIELEDRAEASVLLSEIGIPRLG